MLEVLPIQTKEEQRSACEACRIPYDCDLLAYKLLDDGKLAAACQFRLSPRGGELLNISCVSEVQDAVYIMLLGRGFFNFADLCGMKRAFLCDKTLERRLALAIGFSGNDGEEMSVDLTSFFHSPCQHGHGFSDTGSK